MIGRIVLAVVVAVITTLACMLLGAIIVTLGIPIAVTIGAFLSEWGTVIGVLAGLWHFFSGSPQFWNRPAV